MWQRENKRLEQHRTRTNNRKGFRRLKQDEMGKGRGRFVGKKIREPLLLLSLLLTYSEKLWPINLAAKDDVKGKKI